MGLKSSFSFRLHDGIDMLPLMLKRHFSRITIPKIKNLQNLATSRPKLRLDQL